MIVINSNHLLQQGSVLPLCLFITALISMVAVTMHETANAELRLSATVIESMQADALAEYALTYAFEVARNNPAALPNPYTTVEIKPAAANTDARNTVATIHATHTDRHCPEFFTGERQHYEIIAKAQTSGAGKRAYRLGFYVCREICVTLPCTDSESVPVRSFWTINEWDS